MKQIGGGGHRTAVNVDDVAHGLEREERDAGRKENVEWFEVAADEGLENGQREVGIFEIGQLSEHEDDSQAEYTAAYQCVAAVMNGESGQVVDNSGDRQQHTVIPGVLVVEIIGKGRQIEQPDG